MVVSCLLDFITVRIRSLGRALSRVIGRVLGREDNRDSDEVLKRRRPTTSTRRQREVVVVAEDAHYMDNAAEEVFQQPEEAVFDAQGFLGEPRDTLVLTAYADHVAVIKCPELKLSSHERKVQKFGRSTAEIEGLVAPTGLSLLIACSFDIGDWRLISPFVEGWHKETSSFHLPVGEAIITLDDVAFLLHLRIINSFHSFKTLHVDEVVLMLVELLEVNGDEARAEAVQCYGTYVRLSWLRKIYHNKCEARHWTVAARVYLLLLLGCTFFANKSATHVHVIFLDAFRDLSQSGSYAWGATTLMHMYDNLNDACKSDDKQLAG
ncbi:protein MAIN-LIKE 1-like [Glycine max]|uniref:protein MAIN-LIKE 1-like n=1 Tax=Glycine max TaxID=3847 RepID=UPI0003DE8183|nr:protein MAIN-LIKE 1-like [Glycine max]|eukprot:XP_006598603.1 protein MAIN-LIKE 1-like [Glycine max]